MRFFYQIDINYPKLITDTVTTYVSNCQDITEPIDRNNLYKQLEQNILPLLPLLSIITNTFVLKKGAPFHSKKRTQQNACLSFGSRIRGCEPFHFIVRSITQLKGYITTILRTTPPMLKHTTIPFIYLPNDESEELVTPKNILQSITLLKQMHILNNIDYKDVYIFIERSDVCQGIDINQCILLQQTKHTNPIVNSILQQSQRYSPKKEL